MIDPTRNVLDLVSAAIARQDDLREQESAHVRELMSIRAEFAREIRRAETERIDAIRAVDIGAVQRAAEVAAAQQAALATQVAISAETLRTQVEAKAQAQQVTLSQSLDPIQAAIADLRRAQYETQGKTAQVVETRAGGGSIGMWVGLAVGVAALIVSLVSTIVVIYVASKGV